MSIIRQWTDWKPYRLSPVVEWRIVAAELESCPGVPIDGSAVWVERRWTKFLKCGNIEYHKKSDGWLRINLEDGSAYFIAYALENFNLTEHGGEVGGSWLTDRGKQFLEIGPMPNHVD